MHCRMYELKWKWHCLKGHVALILIVHCYFNSVRHPHEWIEFMRWVIVSPHSLVVVKTSGKICMVQPCAANA